MCPLAVMYTGVLTLSTTGHQPPRTVHRLAHPPHADQPQQPLWIHSTSNIQYFACSMLIAWHFLSPDIDQGI